MVQGRDHRVVSESSVPNVTDSTPFDRGIVHTYQRFDPVRFPSPSSPPPDLTSAAFDHMLAYGSMREFSEEELARAIRLDASMFPSLGPSLESIRAMLEERKRRILETYRPQSALEQAAKSFKDAAKRAKPPEKFREDFKKAIDGEQLSDLERLWYAQKNDQSPFAKEILDVAERLGEKYEIEQLLGKYTFTGREDVDVERAIALKEELEAIEKLLEQLKEAANTAQLAIVDMESLSEFAEAGEIESLNRLQEEIENFVREQAKAQGLEFTREGYKLTPQAYRLFQKTLLNEVFTELKAARSGRHSGPIEGEGVVELERTKPYEFGDSATNLAISQSVANAVARRAQRPGSARFEMGDLEIHRTRNNPKCATAVLMDMSGSMRFDGQYINCKRMALALDGLIRSEFPGDFLSFFEMASFAKQRTMAEVPTLLPKPVSIRTPIVRLKADMANPDVVESRLPQHFTNIQHALNLSRRVLSVQDTPNRQIFLITDALPTAHFEGTEVFFLYPADPRTEEATLREARTCAKEGIIINIFLLPNWGQSEDDVRFAHRLAESTRGRVFFSGGKDLSRMVVWDYVKNRRKIL